MTAFWIAAALLLLAALGLLLPPLLRRRLPEVAAAAATASTARAAAAGAGNVAILREQLAHLDAEHADGLLDADSHRIARREIERRVLDEEAVGDVTVTATGTASGTSTGTASGPSTGSIGATPRRTDRALPTAIVLILLVPALAAGLYARLGSPQAVGLQAAAPAAADNVSMQDVEAMVAKLAARMEAEPGDPQGWTLLGRTYAAMQRFSEAERAFGKAVALAPNDAQLLADQADVLAMVNGGRVDGDADRLVQKALKIAPTNPKALALAGSAAYERRDYPRAVAYWTSARLQAPEGSEFAAGLDRSIAEARSGGVGGTAGAAAGSAGGDNGRAVGAPPVGDGTAAVATAPAAAAAASAPGTQAVANSAENASANSTAAAGHAASLSGRVSLAPALAAKASPDDTVFVFARAAEGPRMPLAIVRKRVADLPFDFTLDDAMAMSPAMKLSGFGRVVIGARVSKSGNAMPQPGDLTGQLGPLPNHAQGLALLVDGVQQ